MKLYFPRLIAWGLLALLGALTTLFHYSTEYLVFVLAVLGIVALGVLAGPNRSLVKTFPWLAFGAVTLGCLLPCVARDPLVVLERIEDLFEAMGKEENNTTWMFVGAFFMTIAQLAFRNRATIVLVFVRYIAVTVFLLGVREMYYGEQAVMYLPIVVNVLIALMYELHTHTFGTRKKRTCSCIFSTLFCLCSGVLFGRSGLMALEALFTLQNWFPVLIAMALFGGLLIVEEKMYELKGMTVSHKELGIACLAWCVQMAVMGLFSGAFHWLALVPAPIIIYYCYSLLMEARWHYRGSSRTTAFFIVWASILMGTLLLGRSLNTYPLTAIAIVLLVIASAIVWRLNAAKGKEELGATCMFGVSAVVLLILSNQPALNDIPGLVLSGLSAALICSAWCYLCTVVLKLKASVGKAYMGEFKNFSEILHFIPAPIMLAAVIRILFH